MAWPTGSAAWAAAASATGRQRLAGGQPELLVDDVETGDQLGHAMLHLEPGVDLEEVEGPRVVPEELGRRRVLEPTGGRHPDGQVVEVTPLGGRQARRGRLLDELLVASLGRAVAFADGDDRPGRVAQELDLDVARGPDLAFQEDRPVAERRRGLGRSRCQRGRQVGGASNPAHPPSPAAGRRLDQQRIADPVGLGDDRGHLVGTVDRHRIEGPGDALDPDRPRDPSGPDLVPERLDDRRWRPDEDEPGVLDRSGEGRPLGQEAVARMDRRRRRSQGPPRPPGRSAGSSRSVVAARAGRRDRPAGRASNRRRHRCRRRPPPCPSRGRRG